MKRIAAIALCALALALLGEGRTRASVDVSMGGTLWYCWWAPAWTDGKTINSFITRRGINFGMLDSRGFDTRSNFLAGPLLSLRFFDRLEISSVAAAGDYAFRSRGITRTAILNVIPGPQGPLSMSVTDYERYYRKVTKWDIDTTASYIVNSYFKVFAGYKHQGYNYVETFYNSDLYRNLSGTGSGAYIRRKLSNRVTGNGAGVGVGFTAPLYAHLYLITNLSGIILWVRDDMHMREAYLVRSTNISIHLFLGRKGSFISYGGSASLSLAYHVESIHTTFSLGGRYQLLRNRQRFGNNLFRNDVALNVIDGEYDHFAGITLSAVYSFTLGKGAAAQ